MDYDLHVQDIVTVPLVIWTLGVVIWIVAAIGRRAGKGGRWKWVLAYGVVLLSAYAAWSGMGGPDGRNLGMGNYFLDPTVRGEYTTTKLVVFQYASFFGPLASVIVLAIMDRFENKRMLDIVS